VKIFVTILLVVIYTASASAQAVPDTVYLDKDKKKTTSQDYVVYLVTTPIADGKFTIEIFRKNGTLLSRGTFSSVKPERIKEGHFTYFAENGVKMRDCYFKQNQIEGEELLFDTLGHLKLRSVFNQGKLNGNRTEYYTTGVIKRDEIYKDSIFVSGNCYNKKGKKVKFFSRDILPEYPGGEKAMIAFVRANLKYPKADMDSNIQGRVVVKFIVEADGSITNIDIAKGVDALIDEAAMDIVRQFPKFIPGTSDGKPIRVSFALPIVFALK